MEENHKPQSQPRIKPAEMHKRCLLALAMIQDGYNVKAACLKCDVNLKSFYAWRTRQEKQS